MSLKKFVLSHRGLYEFYFFIKGKKINKRKLDRKLLLLQNGQLRFPKNRQNIDVLVSLTSYGERLNDLKYTLYSLLQQTVKPEKIIVWLAFGEELSNELKQFEKKGIEFKFCRDTKSYKKLIPALKEFSNKVIVTADDDIYYRKNWLKKLWYSHLKNPECKITHIAHRLCFDKKGMLEPYIKWAHNVITAPSRKQLFPTGCGGTLYPPHPVKPDFLDESLFMKICPKADDVWFYFMGLLSGQKTVIVSRPCNHLKYVDIYKEYGLNGKSTLQAVNVEQNLNDVQIRNVMQYFGIDDQNLYQLIME